MPVLENSIAGKGILRWFNPRKKDLNQGLFTGILCKSMSNENRYCLFDVNDNNSPHPPQLNWDRSGWLYEV